ncbi:hypothetical protein GYB59_02170 [bacterium]|nr:hypothetical protein [bacterium]
MEYLYAAVAGYVVFRTLEDISRWAVNRSLKRFDARLKDLTRRPNNG